MGLPLRARTDCSWIEADTRLLIDRGVRDDGLVTPAERAHIMGLAPILPGDAWRAVIPMVGHFGYAIVCPACRQVHLWPLAHSSWRGDLASGTLSADQSLHASDLPPGQPACDWIGRLSSGELFPA